MLWALVSLTLLGLNILFCGLLLYPLMFLKWLALSRTGKNFFTRIMVRIGEAWIAINNWNFRVTQKIDWQVRGLEGLRYDRSYLVCSNHLSWMDILVLQKIFNRRIPFLRFFLKQELMYLPILGQAWWALDYPVMKRYSKEYLKAHPEKAGKDLETTRRATEKFRGQTVSIINFLEGTRWTPAKHAQQQSSFRHLLFPKAGGLAFVLQAMGDQFDSILDVTIVYKDGVKSLTETLKGKPQRIFVDVRQRPIPVEFLKQNYSENEKDREEFQAWVRNLWLEKDQLIEDIKKS